MRNIHLAGYVNIEADYYPETETLKVRRYNNNGRVIRRVSLEFSEDDFFVLQREISNRFGKVNAPEDDFWACYQFLRASGALAAIDPDDWDY